MKHAHSKYSRIQDPDNLIGEEEREHIPTEVRQKFEDLAAGYKPVGWK